MDFMKIKVLNVINVIIVVIHVKEITRIIVLVVIKKISEFLKKILVDVKMDILMCLIKYAKNNFIKLYVIQLVQLVLMIDTISV